MRKSARLVKADHICPCPKFECLREHERDLLPCKSVMGDTAHQQHHSWNAHWRSIQAHVQQLQHDVNWCLLELGCFKKVKDVVEELQAESKSIQVEDVLQNMSQSCFLRQRVEISTLRVGS